MEKKLSRRDVLVKSATAGIGLSLLGMSSACSSAVTNSKYMNDIGIQLWTVRNQLAENPEATLKSIKDAGYKQVELMDTYQDKAMIPVIKDLGLGLNSSFFLWTLITDRWDLVEKNNMPRPPADYSFNHLVEDAEKLGLSHLVFGYMMPEERSTLDDYKRITEKLNTAGELCQSAGIQLCYHNHSFEFEKVEGEIPFEYYISNFEKELVKFELDIFWADLGGFDPIALMKRLDGRIAQLHLKDKLKDTPVIFNEGEVPQEAFKELGNGVIDIANVINLAETLDVAICHVEQDHSPDPLSSITQSIEYLNKL